MKGIVFDGAEMRVVDGLEVRDPGPGEVKVQIVNSGVCHSDVSVLDGTIPYPVPVVMGHEGAGVVVEVGSGVTSVTVGDHVVLSTLGNCGACPACDSGRPTMCKAGMGQERPQPFTLDGEPLYNYANISTFTEHTVVKALQAVPVPKEMPLTSAALIGCGVLTGAGAVFNRAKVRPGESAVVVGTGGIGLNVLQALRFSGAHPIIAIDANPAKEALAVQFGATHFVNASLEDPFGAVQRIRPGGVAYAFECVGSNALIEQCIQLIDWGGTVVIIGVPPLGSSMTVVPFDLYQDKTIMGNRYGSARPHADIPRIAELYLGGRYLLDELVTAVYPMDDIHGLVHDMHEGRLARGVLDVCPL
ncbi:MAG: alcohol dehydrogenase catalytic domain-containing protein [Acidimicrobiales bacterium]|jgi:S-(hydroxymethyl)glutathione dehydrogenase/alcohol dehydrogenase|nr:alcohol dehydrogenase catalytic domain-containing protein [Acidimicrobiales bacterium]